KRARYYPPRVAQTYELSCWVLSNGVTVGETSLPHSAGVETVGPSSVTQLVTRRRDLMATFTLPSDDTRCTVALEHAKRNVRERCHLMRLVAVPFIIIR